MKYFLSVILVLLLAGQGWGANIITNPEFSSDTSTWTAFRATKERVDFSVSPDIAPTGGTDDYGLAITTTTTDGQVVFSFPTTAGDIIIARARAYSPSTNTGSPGLSRMYVVDSASNTIITKSATTKDTWTNLVLLATAVDDTTKIQLRNWTDTPGDIAYFDSISVTVVTFSATNFYVNPDCTIWGDGLGQECAASTGASGAFINFDAPNLFTGDLGDSVISIAKGTHIREMLWINGGDNYTITSYGTGDNPIIDGSDVITDEWTAEDSLWYLAGQAGNRAIFVDDVQMIDRTDKVDLENNNQWFDSVNSRIYIKTTVNPNEATVEANTDTRLNCIRVSDADTVTITGITAQRSYSHNISVGQSDNITITDNISKEAGCASDCSGGGGRDGILVYGDDETPNTNITITDNTLYRNNNCGIEIWGLDGVTISGNEIYDNGNGIELWGYISNAVIEKNYIYDIGLSLVDSFGHGDGVWATDLDTSPPDTGNHVDNTIRYNIITGVSAGSLALINGSGWVVTNNYLHSRNTDRLSTVYLGYGSNGTEFEDIVWKNNIIYTDNITAENYNLMAVVATTFDASNNLYYWDGGPTTIKIKYNGSDYTDLSTYATASGESNSLNTAPLLNADYSLIATSPAINAGSKSGAVSFTSTQEDYFGNEYFFTPYDTLNIGADQSYSRAAERPTSGGVIKYGEW